MPRGGYEVAEFPSFKSRTLPCLAKIGAAAVRLYQWGDSCSGSAAGSGLACISLEERQTQLTSPGTNQLGTASACLLGHEALILRAAAALGRVAGCSPCLVARSSAGVAQLLSRGRAGVAASVCVPSGVCWVAVFSRFVFVFCEFLKSCFLFLAKRSLVHPLQAGITACSRSVPAGSRFGGCSGSCYCSWWESA